MRNLILKMSLSADGYVGGPNGEIDWLLRTMDDEAAAWTVDKISRAGVHIMGSRTFHDMAVYWPTSTEVFAAPMNSIPKIMFSRKGNVQPSGADLTTGALKDATKMAREQAFKTALSPDAGTWDNAPVLSGDLATGIRQLKEQEGGPLLAHGGAGFAQSLVATGLIDEYQLLIHPVVLGKGLPLFTSLPAPLFLQLKSTTSFRSGTIANIYRPVK
jgi:dihydrofolate reductase